jgi:hypothetical protein
MPCARPANSVPDSRAGRASSRGARPSFSAWRTMPHTLAALGIRCSFYNYKEKNGKTQGCCVALLLRAVRQHVDGSWLNHLGTSWCAAVASAAIGSGISAHAVRGMD